jgi:hypothetical protein
MEKSCSFVGVGGISCGASRGLREISCLFDCKEDMSGQLSNCHLSKSNSRESEFIDIRAGMFNRTEDQLKIVDVILTVYSIILNLKQRCVVSLRAHSIPRTKLLAARCECMHEHFHPIRALRS